jgi:fibronectin-binding autotransporter adhesin
VRPRFLPLIILASLGALPRLSAAQNLNWNPNSNSLNNTGNWSGIDPTGNDLTFDTAAQFNLNLTSDLTVRSMLFTGNHPAYGFNSNNGATLTLTNGVTMSANSIQTVTFQSGLALALSGGQTWEINASSLVVNGVVSGASGITKTGQGSLTLAGANTFTGGVTINNGTLLLGSSSSGSVTAGPVGTGSLTLGNGTKLGIAASAGPVAIANAVSLDPGASTNVTVDTANGNLTLSGVVSGAASLTKTAANTLTLNGTNTYTGATIVNGGAVSVSSLANGGTNSGIGASSNAAANLVLNGGGLAYTGSSATTNRLFTLGTNGGGFSVTGANTALTLSNTGSVALDGTNAARTLKFAIDQSTSTLAFAPVVGDNGTGKTSLVKEGSGKLNLNSANTYTGSTWIKAGTLNLGTSTALSDLTAVIVDSGASLTAHDIGVRAGSIAGAGTIALAGPSTGVVSLTTGGDNTSTTFSGLFREDDHVNSVGLIKTGTGTLTLTGANSYGGGTSITGGMIVAGNNSALGTGSITLNGGGVSVASGVTLSNSLIFSATATVLGGNGTIGTAITADSHVVISPGNSPGKLTFSAGLTLASGSAISFQIQDAAGTAGVGYDLISVTGGVLNLTAPSNTITFNLSTLNADGNAGSALNFNPNAAYSWTFANSPNANITGFNPAQFHLVNSFTNSVNGGSFSFGISGDQRSLLLNFTPVPEPSTWILLGSGLGALALRFRRRRV